MEECEKTLQDLFLKNMDSRNTEYMNESSSDNISDLDKSLSTSTENSSPMSSDPDTDVLVIYVISRISGLANCIQKIAPNFVHREIAVIDLPPPVDSDIFDCDACSSLARARLVVIDPVLLAKNYQRMPVLQWVHSTWAGVECLFTSMKHKPQFVITRHAGEEFGDLIAEYVLGQVLTYERGFIMHYLAQEQKIWNDQGHGGRTLNELTISVLGAGNMAQAIARCFKPHATKVIALARTRKKEKDFPMFDRVTLSLNEAIECCDYLVNTLPHTSLTAGMLNGEVLRGCLKCPIFINVGRGSIIHESSLINAIESNWIAGAVLDVFDEEPLPQSSPLWDAKMVLITPHCAAVSRADHVAKSFAKALHCCEQVRPLPNVVDWEAEY